MAADPITVARESIAAVNARDPDALCRLAHEDVEIHSQLSAVEGPYRGYEGVARWFADMAGFGFLGQSGHEFHDLGDGRVFLIGTSRFRGPASGIDIENPWGAIGELRDGRLLRLWLYTDVEKARADAGLSPA